MPWGCLFSISAGNGRHAGAGRLWGGAWAAPSQPSSPEPRVQIPAILRLPALVYPDSVFRPWVSYCSVVLAVIGLKITGGNWGLPLGLYGVTWESGLGQRRWGQSAGRTLGSLFPPVFWSPKGRIWLGRALLWWGWLFFLFFFVRDVAVRPAHSLYCYR